MAQAGAATLVSHARSGNRTLLELDAGAAEIEFLTASTFRLRRAFAGRLPEVPRTAHLTVPMTIEEPPGELVFLTRYLRVALRRNGLLVSVSKVSGAPVMADATEAQYCDGAMRVERTAAGSPAFYGLGARVADSLNARGTVVRAGVPFLYSTSGYGEYFASTAAYTFNLALTDHYLVEARGPGYLDYYFCYGPTPKEVFEELQMAGVSIPKPPPAPAAATWTGLRNALARLMHASFSGLMAPTFEEAPWRGAEPALGERASQLASLINGSRPELGPYRFAYQQEVRDRGLPPLRPLPFQFPSDTEAPKHSDEFMFGDELLAAPLLSPVGARSVYLPMGVWTLLDTNQTFTGRQTVKIDAAGLPLFARNGSIVPLQYRVLELHYFPKLGAEFFIYENDAGEYSQVHAAPAADVMRLEIESARDREYEWVVHHCGRPQAAGFEGRAYAEITERGRMAHETWFYDAVQKNLHVRVRVAAGEDRIVNVTF